MPESEGFSAFHRLQSPLNEAFAEARTGTQHRLNRTLPVVVVQHVVAGERVLEPVVLDLEREVAEVLAKRAQHVGVLRVQQGQAAVVEPEPWRRRVADDHVDPVFLVDVLKLSLQAQRAVDPLGTLGGLSRLERRERVLFLDGGWRTLLGAVIEGDRGVGVLAPVVEHEAQLLHERAQALLGHALEQGNARALDRFLDADLVEAAVGVKQQFPVLSVPAGPQENGLGWMAKIEVKPMPNLPILVRSSSFDDENRRVSSLSMMASSIPSPKSSTWMRSTPRGPSSSSSARSSGGRSVARSQATATSMRGDPASIEFCASSRRKSSGRAN